MNTDVDINDDHEIAQRSNALFPVSHALVPSRIVVLCLCRYTAAPLLQLWKSVCSFPSFSFLCYCGATNSLKKLESCALRMKPPVSE